MNTIKISIFALFLTSSFGLLAQTLMVSDMDDTIKVSHVLDKDSVTANAPMIHNVFLGMPELYHLISKTEDFEGIKYLSNAPKKLFGDIHEKFLDHNNFPKGEFVARRWRDIFAGNTHKIKSLRRFIEQHGPSELILIGDNGEADPEVYAQIREEFPEIKGPTYIRLAYSTLGYKKSFGKQLEEGQIPFVSSLDIAIDLFNKGKINSESLTQLVLEVTPAILEEDHDENRGPTAFPEWYDCRDFTLPEMPVLTDLEANDLLQKYAEKTRNRCSREPFDD